MKKRKKNQKLKRIARNIGGTVDDAKALLLKKKILSHRYGQTFYTSERWLKVKFITLKRYGKKCMKCGVLESLDSKIHIDHIKPKSRYPSLKLNLDNLQILCERCNLEKSNINETDFRPQIIDRKKFEKKFIIRRKKPDGSYDLVVPSDNAGQQSNPEAGVGGKAG